MVPDKRDQDAAMTAYIKNLNLSSLDLSHIELDLAKPRTLATRFKPWKLGKALGKKLNNLTQSWVWRWLIMCLVILGMSIMLFVLPAQADWLGNTLSPSWFLSVGIAITTGLLLGRGLILYGEAHQHTTPWIQIPTIQWPSWFKWVNLAILSTVGTVLGLAHWIIPEITRDVAFGLSFLGFGLGISSSIWLVRRFEDLEQQALSHKTQQDRP